MEIDRASDDSKHHFRGRLLAILIASAFIISLIATMLIAPTPSEGNPTAPDVPARITYTAHADISINGNAGFLGSNASTGITKGSGTASDPYIIEGWEMNLSSSASMAGISITNANVHFMIRNCFVHDGGVLPGIRLHSCSNGTVFNNNCSKNLRGIDIRDSNKNTLTNNNCSDHNSFGIYLFNSSGNTLSNNTCSGNAFGITLETSCNNNTISNNTCESNDWGGGINLGFSCNYNDVQNNTCQNNNDGIYLYSSVNNAIRNNNCSDNHRAGISLDSSSDCSLADNVMIADGVFIQGDLLSHYNTHDIGTSNTVNGKPVYYYKNLSGITVPAGAGEVILANCTDFVIENYILSDATVGIEIAFSSGVLISNNTCSSDNQYGIYLYISSNNTLTNNNCSNNSGDGVSLVSSSNNTLSNNNCSDDYCGLSLESSSNNALVNNTCSNGGDGIYLWSSSDNNTLTNNTCNLNWNSGIYLWACSNIISWNEVCNNTSYGVLADFGSSDNRIWNNTFIGNNGAGSIYDINHIQAYDAAVTDNWWNSSSGFGNYWSDLTSPDSLPPFGIVDWSYNLTGGAKDYYPLTTQSIPPWIPEFSNLVVPIIGLMLIFMMMSRMRKKPYLLLSA